MESSLLASAWGGVFHANFWIASAAATLQAAASLAMGLPISAPALGLVVAGVLVIYNLDRLRDVDRDRTTAPERSRFVQQHRFWLWILCGVSLLWATGLLLEAPLRVWLLVSTVGVLALAHRRLKRIGYAKEIYLTLAWVGGVVGLPTAFAPGTHAAMWASAALVPPLLANDIAASIQDREGLASLWGAPRAMTLARLLALFGLLATVAMPESIRPLCSVSATTLAALFWFREGEGYRMLVMDGALTAGALIALVFYLV